eukprot:TRINITY_DN10110_c0_g1_i1.p2 TRINITY_DN10110_c0_g1~~TRINITY_DN10110_c0_g1_i1.p2  ORF type:complete len:156 (-),score=65.34 TRINITY_DN10110_c0_g1_i1:181-648(-)
MHGWRVGYIAYPESIQDGLEKVQDTIPINVCQISQQLAKKVLSDYKSDWARDQVKTIQSNREIIWDAVAQMTGTVKTCGAFYFFVKLPMGIQDEKAVKFLAENFKVGVLPGNSSGMSGYLRVSYGNLKLEECQKASLRLKQGLASILRGEMSDSS